MQQSDTAMGCRFSACLSDDEDTDRAVAEVCQASVEQLEGKPDLAIVFASPHHVPNLERARAQVARRTSAACLLGCTAESIVGNEREIEQEPALAIWLAKLPGATIRGMHLRFEHTGEGGRFVGWPDALPEPWAKGSAILLLGDPFTFPADALVERLNEDQPGIPVLGGMASGGSSPGENRLLFNDNMHEHGAVAALVHGPFEVRSVVSQGCRPIGKPYVVTKAQQNVILELGGAPPLARLEELFNTLSPREQQLVQQGLHVGRAINEYRDQFGRGDFLVRNCLGADRGTGAIAIGDFVRVGQTVQFHVRDGQTADEDLRELLGAETKRHGDHALGALVFTCNGRGTRLFDAPNHDTSVVGEMLGELPRAGFFAQGELGPIGGKNFLHGFTASIALFVPGQTIRSQRET